MARYTIRLLPRHPSTAQLMEIVVDADQFQIDLVGLLSFSREGRRISAFAPGEWISVQEQSPDKYAEATKAWS